MMRKIQDKAVIMDGQGVQRARLVLPMKLLKKTKALKMWS